MMSDLNARKPVFGHLVVIALLVALAAGCASPNANVQSTDADRVSTAVGTQEVVPETASVPEPPQSASIAEVSLPAPSPAQATPAAEPPAPSPVVPATALKGVTATSSKDGVVIKIEANGALKDYQAFTLSDNPRIVFDLPGIVSPYKGEQRAAAGGVVQQVRHMAYPDKVRVVVETQKTYLGKYAAEPVEDGLIIRVGDAAAAAPRSTLHLVSTPAVAVAAMATQPAPASGGPAWVNRVSFADEPEGRSAVIISTTRPVQYEISRSEGKRATLRLLNTSISESNRRPLITTRFESAVDRVTPAQVKGETVVTIELRESVPYTAEQIGNVIRIDFAASTIPPKPYESGAPPLWKEPQPSQGASPSDAVTGQSPPPALPGSQSKPVISQRGPIVEPQFAGIREKMDVPRDKTTKLYTGEKVALDFYETDIKNVFRILKEVSGKNFAVDKNVTGKVTLSIDKPVPWDQVLDLILKMNQLGRIVEGDVIRIATMQTLALEEKERLQQLDAEKKAKLAEDRLTAFIPINYANAKQVLEQHVLKLLTPGEIGRASVDDRTNMIVVTDISEVIRRVKEVISKVDTVTPQVVIEARIVEANASFSREIGFDWGTITIEAFKIGGALKTGPTTLAANNIPTTFNNNNTIGFNMSTLFGTNISIVDAKLSASELEGRATIISSPKVITLNGKKAAIKQGVEVPYLERDSSGNATVKFKDVDLLLEVTPNVSLDRRINMSIFLTKNDVIDPTAPEPALSTNEAKTEILVDDGDTIVIGGILKDTKKLTEQGIPGLRKAPAFGWLFRAEKIESTKSELLIFMTPRIIQLQQRKDLSS
jgi:type IV pilus assembly protein PilQ